MSSGYDMTRRQTEGMLRLVGSITSDMPIRSANGLRQTTTTAGRRHTLHRFEGGTIGYFNIFECLASELRFMRYTREIHMHLHFDGLSPFIHTATNMHILSAVITHPVRGRVFPLAAYSGTAKLNDIERVLASSFDQIAHIQVTLLLTSRRLE